jgi:hypothetical protein
MDADDHHGARQTAETRIGKAILFILFDIGPEALWIELRHGCGLSGGH